MDPADADLQLGRKVPIPATPADAIIDLVPAPPDHFLVRLSCPEFTSLCPYTGQPDFAHIVIDYIPQDYLIESKALKLYLASFRNHGAFHEAVTCEIGNKLADVAQPMWLRVNAFWFPRGGIPIDVFWEVGDRPVWLYLPQIDIQTYRAR
jgi:7-cyano-7-deazaguanine reductase